MILTRFSLIPHYNRNKFNNRRTWLFLDARWDRPIPKPSRKAITFLWCFLLYNLSGVSRFLFTFLWSGIFKIWLFSLHSRVVFFSLFPCFLVCVCVCWGGSVLDYLIMLILSLNNYSNFLQFMALASKVIPNHLKSVSRAGWPKEQS